MRHTAAGGTAADAQDAAALGAVPLGYGGCLSAAPLGGRDHGGTAARAGCPVPPPGRRDGTGRGEPRRRGGRQLSKSPSAPAPRLRWSHIVGGDVL